jgi:hypothetical protein
MHQYSVIGSAFSNGRRSTPAGTVVVLLTLVEDRPGVPLTPPHPAKVPADLEAKGSRPGPTGSVAILLTLVEDRTGLPYTRVHAARVLANLRTVDALPTLGRLASLSCEGEVRAAAKEAFERITRERQAQQPVRRRHGFWRRLESVLRHFLGHPCW